MRFFSRLPAPHRTAVRHSRARYRIPPPNVAPLSKAARASPLKARRKRDGPANRSTGTPKPWPTRADGATFARAINHRQAQCRSGPQVGVHRSSLAEIDTKLRSTRAHSGVSLQREPRHRAAEEREHRLEQPEKPPEVKASKAKPNREPRETGQHRQHHAHNGRTRRSSPSHIDDASHKRAHITEHQQARHSREPQPRARIARIAVEPQHASDPAQHGEGTRQHDGSQRGTHLRKLARERQPSVQALTPA